MILWLSPLFIEFLWGNLCFTRIESKPYEQLLKQNSLGLTVAEAWVLGSCPSWVVVSTPVFMAQPSCLMTESDLRYEADPP